MCIRLNNLIQLKQIRKYFYEKYSNIIQKFNQHLVKSKTRQAITILQQFKIELYKIKLYNRTVELKLDKLASGLLGLLVYRFNLFCKKALFLLLSDELNSYPTVNRVKPLTNFLTINFNMLKNQLYPNLFQKFLKLLWNSFHDSFQELIQKFDDESVLNPKNESNTYLKIIDLLTHIFKGYSTNNSYLELKMKRIKFVLNIFSQNTNNLILLYYKLFNFTLQKLGKRIEINDGLDLIHLVKISKKLRKPFNGKFFSNYLRKIRPFNKKAEEFGKDASIRYAQVLLEANYLETVQSKNKIKKTRPSKRNDIDMNSYENLDYQSLNLLNYNTIYLATKMNFYKLNIGQISKLTDNLLFRNTLLNQEIEKIFPKSDMLIGDSKFDQESNQLFDKCLEYSIDHEFIMKILWHRIYQEPIVMKFISIRHSNYANNSVLDNKNDSNSPGFLSMNDNIPVFPLF